MRRLFLAAVIAVLAAFPANAQPASGADPVHILSAASTNSTLVRSQPSLLYSIVAINTTTTLYYLKFYDIAVAPTCASTPVVLTIPVPFGAANAGGGVSIQPPAGFRFFNGVGICLTGAIGDTDNTVAAAGVAIDLAVK